MAKAKTLAIFALLLAVLSLSNVLVTGCAQEKQNPQSSEAASTKQAVANEQEPAKEAQGQESDPNEAFRHSDSVKVVARITGLSLDAAYWLCIVLNFILVVGILWVLLRKAIPAAFRNRTEAIQKRLEEARKASEDARHRLTEVEARLSKLDSEIERMRREAEAGFKTEEERVMKAAEEERQRIVQSTEQEIATAANAARRELKAYVAELAVSLAEKKMRITESTDETLVRHFASRLGKDN